MDDDEWRLLSELARRFYLDDESKTDLAAEFSMSRFRIARLLQQAREHGVVTIQVNERDSHRTELSAELASHLGLRECLVIKAGDSEEATRRSLARAAAAHLRRQVRDGDLVGLSWGRTLVALGEELADLPPCTLVQLTGTVGNDFTQSPVEVIRRIADRSSVETVSIFCPLFASSQAAARSLRSDTAIRRALDLYDHLDLAVLSLGSWDPPITQLSSFATAADREELTRAEAKAELAGIFLRSDGTLVDASLTRRRISISAQQLVRTRRVLVVAGTVEKVGAIGAAARSGLITSLVTDDKTALALRRLPAVTSHVLERAEDVPPARPGA